MAAQVTARARRLGASDLARLEARGAHIQALGSTADEGAHALNVGVPAARGAAVGVRDRVAPARALAANITGGSHGDTPRKSQDAGHLPAQ